MVFFRRSKRIAMKGKNLKYLQNIAILTGFIWLTYLTILINNITVSLEGFRSGQSDKNIRYDELSAKISHDQNLLDELNNKYNLLYSHTSSIAANIQQKANEHAYSSPPSYNSHEINSEEQTVSTKEENTQDYSQILGAILDKDSTLIDNEKIIVNITPEQQKIFQQLGSKLDDSVYVSTLNLSDFSKSREFSTLPRPLQMLLLNKAASLYHSGYISQQ